MGLQWDKQPASRAIVTQLLSWTGSASVISTNFSSETFQVRLVTTVSGNVWIDNSIQVSTSTFLPGFLLQSGVPPEYFTVTPGQLLSFTSTSTSSGTISIAEMA